MKKSVRFSSICKKNRGRPKMTQKKQVAKEIKNIGLKKEDAIDRENRRSAVADPEIFDDGMKYFAYCIKINFPQWWT